jgi:hypothetical protein
MYTITNPDEIGLNAIINNKMIIGVVDRHGKRTCIMQTHIHNDLYDKNDLCRYVVLPFKTNRKIYNDNMDQSEGSLCCIEDTNINNLIDIGGNGGLSPEKSFDSWKEAYEWMLDDK